MIERRQFLIGAGALGLLAAAPAFATSRGAYGGARLAAKVAQLERRSGGRLV